MMDEIKRAENPFYSNHVFTEFDRGRAPLKLTWGERIILRFLPTYVQIADCGYVFFYKRWQGRYYLVKETPMARNHILQKNDPEYAKRLMALKEGKGKR